MGNQPAKLTLRRRKGTKGSSTGRKESEKKTTSPNQSNHPTSMPKSPSIPSRSAISPQQPGPFDNNATASIANANTLNNSRRDQACNDTTEMGVTNSSKIDAAVTADSSLLSNASSPNRITTTTIRPPSSTTHQASLPYNAMWLPFTSTFRPLAPMLDAYANSVRDVSRDNNNTNGPMPMAHSGNGHDSTHVSLPDAVFNSAHFSSFFHNPIAGGNVHSHAYGHGLTPNTSNSIHGEVGSDEANLVAAEILNEIKPRLDGIVDSKDQYKKSAGSILSLKTSRRERGRRSRRSIHKKLRGALQAQAPLSPTTSKDRDRDLSPEPAVLTIDGKRVTIVDEELKVFVIDLLSAETCEMIRTMTNNHVRQVHESGNQVPTWRTLYTYTKQDLPCGEVKDLTSKVTDQIMASVIGIVGQIFGKPKEALKLRQRSWKEPHLLLYQNVEGIEPHTGVEMHYDGCDITWNACITRSDEYEGGGTYIRALRKTIRLEQGQVLVHPGELYHKGCDITAGIRLLIVCFMDGFDPKIQDTSSAKTDREEYEKNVRSY